MSRIAKPYPNAYFYILRISVSTKGYEENVGYNFWPLMAVILRLFSCIA